MTYCVALKLDEGLVMLADTRTNAGVDNVSRFTKMFTWEVPGERALCLMAAGNLSITQGVITRIDTALRQAEEGGEVETILTAPSMYRVAELVGEHMHEMQEKYREAMMDHNAGPDATILLAGQRAGGRHRLFMIYSPGNFIEATEDTPFFQIGEHKYGKPILDRVIRPETPLPRALKAVYVSMDSTLRSNLSVGMPLDLAVVKAGENRFSTRRRIEPDDAEFTRISEGWSQSLGTAFAAVPDIELG